MNDFNELHALYHHGIKGQKWGYRRFQNEDGTFTEAGKERYRIDKSGKPTGVGKKKFKVDQRAIKGQQLYESGKTIGGIQSKKTIINTILGAIGGLSIKAAFSGTNRHNIISKGEAQTRYALLGIGAVSLAGFAANEVVSDIQTRNMRAYYSNGGSRQYERIYKDKGGK